MAMAPAKQFSSGLSQQIDDVMHKLFDEDSVQFDLKGGVVRSMADKRVIYLSEDLLRGLYRALQMETGQAWAIILKNCGTFWGKQVVTNLNKSLQTLQQKNLGELVLPDYLGFLEAYFCHNGWGVLQFDLNHAKDKGVVHATLQNSLFVQALTEVQHRVDFLVSGMLVAMFEEVSGTEIDCVQICCERDSSDKMSHFMISGQQRVEKLDATIKGTGKTLAEALEAF